MLYTQKWSENYLKRCSLHKKKKKMFSSYIKAAVSNPTFKWSKSSYSQPSEDLLEGNCQVITTSQQFALLWRSAAVLLFLQLLSRSPQMPEGWSAPGPLWPWSVHCPFQICSVMAHNRRIKGSGQIGCPVSETTLKIVIAVQSCSMENVFYLPTL